MKKVLLVLAVLLGTLSAYAGSDLKVVSGDAKILKNGGDVTVTFDFVGATWDGVEPLANHYPNLTTLIGYCPGEFARKFNKECKKSKYVPDAAAAKYLIKVKATNMDSYYNVMGFGLPGHVTKLWGTMTIVDKATGQDVCVIKIDEVDGGRNIMIDESFKDCIEELGEQTAKLFNKGK